MLTRSAKNYMACMPLSCSVNCSSLQVVNLDAIPRFITTAMGDYPASRNESFTLYPASSGISLGTDGTPATENDWNLGNTITSGISVTVSNKASTFVNGQPAIKYTLTVSNTGSEAITIREAGIKQSIKTLELPAVSTSSSSTAILIDRTVFDEPVTIQPSDVAIIEYSIFAKPAIKMVSGVECTSFLTASDAQVAAMIDAARQGIIDLQADCGWAVGDVRTIHINAWTGGDNVANAAEDIDIVITAFGDYMDCGCLFQFDFMESCTKNRRINSSNTNVGGYGSTEMYTTTLPALMNALPEWMRTRLKTFDVLASAGSGSTTIETVGGNKLALRSEVEAFGTNVNSAEGEGSQVAWYKRNVALRIKRLGRAGSNSNVWLRSPYVGDWSEFCTIYYNGGITKSNAMTGSGLCPFGCI